MKIIESSAITKTAIDNRLDESFWKRCSKCEALKPRQEFWKYAQGSDGLQSRCKSCSKSCAAASHAENPGLKKARAAAYYAANQADVLARTASWRRRNPEKKREYAEKWHASNPEKARASVIAYQLNNPDASRIRLNNRRAKQQANGGELSKGLAVKLFKLQKGKCPCCARPLGRDYHMDHIIPLSKGGANTYENMQLLRKRCNLQKQAKHPVDFMQQRGFLL